MKSRGFKRACFWLCAVACGTRAPSAPTDAANSNGHAQALELTWVVHPATADLDAGPERIIEVVARVGGATRRLALGAHLGYLHPSDQSLCTPSLKRGDVVSQLKLDTFGAKTIFARRVAPERIEISVHVDTDRVDDRVLGAIPIPADATISEGILDMRSSQVQAPFDCHGKASDGKPKEPPILPVSPTATIIDTSDWKSAPPGSTLTATWTVDQAQATAKVRLDLALAGRSHTVSAVGGPGSVRTYDSLCGNLSFYLAGAIVALELKRAEGGKLVLVRREGVPKLKNEQLFVFDVPKEVPVAHSVVVVDPQGKQTTDTKCKPNTL